jgi:hypothetical protein
MLIFDKQEPCICTDKVPVRLVMIGKVFVGNDRISHFALPAFARQQLFKTGG